MPNCFSAKCCEILLESLLDYGLQCIGNGLGFSGVFEIRQRYPQHPLLKKNNGLQRLNTITDAHFLMIWGRLQNLAVAFVGLPDIVG